MYFHRCTSPFSVHWKWNRLLRCSFYPSSLGLKTSAIICLAEKQSVSRHVQKSDSKSDVSPIVHATRKAKQAVTDVTYIAILLGGVILTGGILYLVMDELFSSKSPNGVYNAAFKVCKEDVRVQDLIGGNIKAHGETNSRGRRRHTAHQSWYDTSGRLHMSMRFYLEGSLGSAVVQLEVVENDAKQFDYRYLLVESEGGFTRKQVFIHSPPPGHH